MADFNSGFREGDKIVVETDRYVRVIDDIGRESTVGDNGERRMHIKSIGETYFDPPLDKPAATGPLSLADIKKQYIKWQ